MGERTVFQQKWLLTPIPYLDLHRIIR